MKRTNPLVAVFVMIAFLLTGCFGSFGATTSLYKWNEGVTSNEFGQTALFWLLIIVPVYEILLVGDFLIFNVIEFWTGDQVFSDATIERGKDGTVIVHSGPDEYVLSPVDGNTLDVERNGEYLGAAVMTDEGSLAFTDTNGEVRVLSQEQLAEMR